MMERRPKLGVFSSFYFTICVSLFRNINISRNNGYKNSSFISKSIMNEAGQYVNALGGIASYKAYKLNLLPRFPEIEMDAEMVSLFSKAHNYLGKLDMISELIPDMILFLGAMFVKKPCSVVRSKGRRQH